jgi:cardiolipin synthase
VEKAKAGVHVRLLYDHIGSLGIEKILQPLVNAGGQVAAFFPSKIPYLNLRLNYRNHRKLAIIDGQAGFVGGINVGDEYLGLVKRFGYWRDTHLKITGSAVYDMQTRFLLDWNLSSEHKLNLSHRFFPPTTNGGDIGVQIVSSGPHSESEQIKNSFLKMIYGAKENIYIQTPYFVPDETLLNALKTAALSGVDVRVMIPAKPDHKIVKWVAFSYMGEVLNAGVKVYQYEKGFLHAKTIVVDGKVSSVGTANFDVRSFKLNFETNALIYDEDIAVKLQQIFINDMTNCRELTLHLYNNRSTAIKFKESVTRLLSPIL